SQRWCGFPKFSQMKFEDTQIDVLLTRHAQNAKAGVTAGHLDADELNTFAEGATPVATRARYISHLAECDDCRRLAAQLAVSAGASASAVTGPTGVSDRSLWQKLTAFFAPLTLRYAAFAAVLILAVGVTFLVLRSERESRLVARKESAPESEVSALKHA